MEKILDSEFRNDLYKNLVEAGYEKKEAQKIIGVKYHQALKADVILKLNQLIKSVEEDGYENEEETTTSIRTFSASLNELRKIHAVIK